MCGICVWKGVYRGLHKTCATPLRKDAGTLSEPVAFFSLRDSEKEAKDLAMRDLERAQKGGGGRSISFDVMTSRYFEVCL